MMRLLLPLTLCLLASPAWAINKCTINGQTVFQDTPCPTGTGGAIVVKPASGHSEPNANGAVSAPPPELERLKNHLAKTQRDNRKFLLEVRLVPDAAAAVESQRRRCDSEIAELRAKKSLANNNLAGATWENALSAEMGAVALRCDTRQRELAARLDALRGECLELGGCAAPAR